MIALVRKLLSRPDARIVALERRSAAKDALRRARVRGDTRSIHEHEAALRDATTALLRAELRVK
jgi:hypothetical protein